jgi:hypothetical protein
MFSLEVNPTVQPMANTDTTNPNLALIDANHSMFPMDNFDLENYRWEDDIIIDPTQMPSIPSTRLHASTLDLTCWVYSRLEPKILTLEYEDDPKLFGIPDDRGEEDKMTEGLAKPVEKKARWPSASDASTIWSFSI